MLNPMTTSFVARLRAQDQAAWFELWETFGPVLRIQLSRWGRGRIGPETVRDLSQETLAALSDCIERYDPAKGARFSTWLLAIAKHVLGDEIDRRNAQKRGGAGAGQIPDSSTPLVRSVALDDSWMTASAVPAADEQYEAAVFRAKVQAALRLTQQASDFTDFEVFRMRVLDAIPGKQVAEQMGMSEPTISRRLAKVRQVLRARLSEVIATYSFTQDELDEPRKARLNTAAPAPTAPTTPFEDAQFDEAVGEIWRRVSATPDPD
ncbi:MAG: sigma-70 family RNA polymerase sigma factor [Phycisphaerales bacterium]|nr:sigma-70 family RNA polymerase sigma factor [Phycisphaerales bacterium]